MIMENLSDILKQEAVGLGLCKQWAAEWGECGQQELIDKFKKGIDFCLERDWPSTDFIKANFDPELLHRNLIYVDERLDLKNAPNGVYVLNGECTGTLWFNSWAAATVYVRHSSQVTIIADDSAKIFVRLYDEADAEVMELDEAVIKVYDRRS